MANKTLQLKIGNTTYRSSVDNTLTNEDLNNVTLPGLYNAGGSNSVTNKPSGIDHFGLLVIHRASGSYYIQIIYNDSKSYRRFCTNGTWSNWTEDKLTDTTYTSLKNPYALTLKFNSGIGTTYDGSSAVTYDITKTALGMNKVDNTADVDKNVKHAKTADSATTATTLGSATIGSNSCGIYLNVGKPVKMNATVGDAHTPIYFLNGTATACSLTKASVGLSAVDNTADANKSVKSATKLQTYRSGNSTSTYGDEYPLYARWEDNGSTVKLTCDNYTVKTDYATAAGSANSVSWGNVSGKPSTFTPASHTHTKSQITDFPSSLKNPNSLTIQTNGTVSATYDGSVAKTVNITKSSIGLGSVDNTADSAKSVKYATTAGSANAVAWGNVSGKPSTFPPSDHSHSYLPLSGGTISGNIAFSDIGDTGKSAGLSWSGSTDGASIYYQTTAADQGNLVLNLTDDDNCYLRIAKNGSFTAYVTPNGAAYFSAVYNAVYNDYAEFFPRGEATEPGDIVALDLTADHESYIKATETSKIVAGVHSDEYAMLIGGDKVDDGNYVEKNIEKYIPVSLCGRVYCKCIGKIHRGDTIVVSEIPGIGRAKLPNDYVENTQIVGYAVDEDMNEEIRRVRIRVKG